MKKKLIAVLLCVCLLMMPVTAFAEPIEPVGVQINGIDVYFAESTDDAWAELFRYVSDKPVLICDDRAYLSADFLLPALGDEDMDAVKEQLKDVSFMEEDTLYVPVRLVAEALDIEVGWDSANRTIIILDKENYLEQLSGEFTLLERYGKEGTLVPGSNMKVEGTLHFALNMTTYDNETGEAAQNLPVTVTVDTSALSSGTKANLNAAISLEIEDFLAAMAQAEDANLDMAMMLQYFQQFHVAYILDLEQGNLYLKSELFMLMGGDADTWYSIYLEDLVEDADYDAYLKLLEQSKAAEKTLDMEAAISSLIDEIPMDDAYAVPSNLQALEMIYDLFADDNFEKTKDGYINAMWDNVFYTKVALTEQSGKLNGMELVFATRDVAEEDLGGSVLLTIKQQGNVCTIQMKTRMDSELGEYLNMQLDGKWVYSQSADAPLTVPQDGEIVADLVTMLEAAA